MTFLAHFEVRIFELYVDCLCDKLMYPFLFELQLFLLISWSECRYVASLQAGVRIHCYQPFPARPALQWILLNGEPLGQERVNSGFFEYCLLTTCIRFLKLEKFAFTLHYVNKNKIRLFWLCRFMHYFFFVFHSNVINPETKQKTKVQKSLDSYEMTSGLV